MNLLKILKQCEPNVSQLARDAGLKRQTVYLWQNGRMPRERVFNTLKSMEKYKGALSKIDYEKERNKVPLGRKCK